MKLQYKITSIVNTLHTVNYWYLSSLSVFRWLYHD